MGRPIKIAKYNTYNANTPLVDIGIPSQTTTGNIGEVGGDALGIVSMLVQANIAYNNGNSFAEGNSYIVRQKGSSKYLVGNVATPSIQGICYLVNITGTSVAALTAGQMAIIATTAAAANVTIAKLDNRYCVAYADQSANAGVKSNSALGQAYWGSFVAANATIQPGSYGAGLYPIILLPHFTGA